MGSHRETDAKHPSETSNVNENQELDTSRFDADQLERNELSLVTKFMLNAELVGRDACSIYEQLYGIPLLQTLGMPLRLAPLAGVVSGPTAAVLVPVLGWLSDKGSNPQRRKMLAVALSTGFMLSGVLCVVVAAVMHLHMYRDQKYQERGPESSIYPGTLLSTQFHDVLLLLNDSWTSYPLHSNQTFSPGSDAEPSQMSPQGPTEPSTQLSEGLGGAQNMSEALPALPKNTSVSTYINETLEMFTTKRSRTFAYREIPFKAWLAFSGYVIFEIGYDHVNCYVRAWVLTCGPRAEHNSLLVTGLIMAAIGGVSTSALGMMGFRYLTDGWSNNSVTSSALVVQVIIQGIVNIVLVLLGMLCSLIIGYRVLQRRRRCEANSKSGDANSKNGDTISKNGDPVIQNCEANNASSDASSKSSDANSKNTGMIISTSADAKKTGDIMNNNCDDVTNLNREGWSSRPSKARDRIPLCRESPDTSSSRSSSSYESCLSDNESCLSDDSDLEKTAKDSKSWAWNLEQEKTGSTCDATEETRLIKKEKPDITETKESKSSRRFDRRGSSKRAIFLICASMCFCCGAYFMFSMMSDYVGKAIFGGDPNAEPGSSRLENYSAGVLTVTWGYLINSVVNLVVNLFHTRLLNFLGHKQEFVLVQALMGGTMVLLAVTSNLWVFFLLSVVTGLHRASRYVIPYAAANDVIQAEAETQDGHGHPRVGLAMSLVGGMVPLCYVTLLPWVGALEDWTGVLATPLWVGACFAFLSATFFIFA